MVIRREPVACGLLAAPSPSMTLAGGRAPAPRSKVVPSEFGWGDSASRGVPSDTQARLPPSPGVRAELGLGGLPAGGVGVSAVSVLSDEGVPGRGVLRRRAGPSSTWPTLSANLSEHTVSPRSSGRVEIYGGMRRTAGGWWAGPGRLPPAHGWPPAPHLQQQHRRGAGTQCRLQQASELRVPEGHVRPAGPQCGHHAA